MSTWATLGFPLAVYRGRRTPIDLCLPRYDRSAMVPSQTGGNHFAGTHSFRTDSQPAERMAPSWIVTDRLSRVCTRSKCVHACIWQKARHGAGLLEANGLLKL